MSRQLKGLGIMGSGSRAPGNMESGNVLTHTAFLRPTRANSTRVNDKNDRKMGKKRGMR